MKNKILISMFILTMAGLGIFTASKVMAENTINGQNPMQNLIQKIAQKFGLKEADVRAVFEEDRADRQIKREEQYIKRLDQLVADKKITAAQKQLIINKHKELQENRQSERLNLQGKTLEERKALMEQKRAEKEKERTELEQWAKDKGIDPQYIVGGFGGGMGRGHGFGFRMGKRPW